MSLAAAIRDLSESDGLVWFVDRNGTLAALTARDYVRMPTAWIETGHVFMTLGSALRFACALDSRDNSGLQEGLRMSDDIKISPNGKPIQRGYHQHSRAFWSKSAPLADGIADEFEIGFTDAPSDGLLAEFVIEIVPAVESFRLRIYGDAIGLVSQMCGDLFTALARAIGQDPGNWKADSVKAVLDSLGFADWTRTNR